MHQKLRLPDPEAEGRPIPLAKSQTPAPDCSCCCLAGDDVTDGDATAATVAAADCDEPRGPDRWIGRCSCFRSYRVGPDPSGRRLDTSRSNHHGNRKNSRPDLVAHLKITKIQLN